MWIYFLVIAMSQASVTFETHMACQSWRVALDTLHKKIIQSFQTYPMADHLWLADVRRDPMYGCHTVKPQVAMYTDSGIVKWAGECDSNGRVGQRGTREPRSTDAALFSMYWRKESDPTPSEKAVLLYYAGRSGTSYSSRSSKPALLGSWYVGRGDARMYEFPMPTLHECETVGVPVPRTHKAIGLEDLNLPTLCTTGFPLPDRTRIECLGWAYEESRFVPPEWEVDYQSLVPSDLFAHVLQFPRYEGQGDYDWPIFSP